MPELNISALDGKSFTVDINIDINQNSEEITLDFVKNKVREEFGVANFNLFITSQETLTQETLTQETPINSDQNIRDILDQGNENDGAINLILISTGDRNLDIELINQCKKEDNSLDVTRGLIEQGADIDKANNYGTTPLLWASYWGHLDIVRYLVEGDADINKASHDGDTPLSLASLSGELEVVRFLVEGGADVDKATNNGNTPLLEASYWGHLEVVRCLVEGGADIDKATPLSWASYRQRHLVVRYLLDQGADNSCLYDGQKISSVFLGVTSAILGVLALTVCSAV